MRLTNIKLCGFKSFVDPTTVQLPSSLVGIVGPNGCGKSNIIDAVRWVMGESSAKNLRGDSMTDVIFNGAATRKPVGQASVELVFDNSDGTIGGEYAGYATISIKRLVNREAQSTYFLNGVRCRKRDIKGVFLGTGLGPRSYSIIEQGMISRFIEAKPDDLRIFLEEAAGISKYKERRRETENRIRHARENVARVTDIRDELDKQLERLQRQSQAAAKFKEFKSRERVLRAELEAIRLRDIDHDSESFTNRLRELETLQSRQHAELQNTNTEIEKSRQGHTEASDTFNEVQKRFYGIGHEITRLEQTINHEKEKRTQMETDLAQVRIDWDKNQTSLTEDTLLIEKLTEEVAVLEPVMRDAKAALDRAQENLNKAEVDMQAWQEDWDSFNENMHTNTKKAEVAQTEIQILEKQVKNNLSKIERIDEEVTRHDTDELQRTVTELETSHAAKQTAFDEAESALVTVSADIGSARDKTKALQAELQDAGQKLQTLSAKQASLETLQKAALGQSDETVTNWLKEKSLDKHQRLVQNMQVEDKWHEAIETVLGDYLEAVCVDDVANVANYIDGLHDGNITLLQKTNPDATTDPRLLASKIKSDIDIAALFGEVYCADTLTEALGMRAQLSKNASVVTQDGIWLGHGWLRVTRKTTDKSGVLAREKELDAVLADIRVAKQNAVALEQELKEATEKLAELEAAKDTKQQEINEKSGELSSLASAIKVKRARLIAISDRVSELDGEKTEAQNNIDQANEAIKEARISWDAAMAATQGSEAKRAALEERQVACKQTLSTHKETLSKERETAHEAELKLQTNVSQLDTLKQGVERLEERLVGLSARREKLHELLNDDSNPIGKIETELNDYLSQRLAVEEEMNTARATLQEIDARIREHETARQGTEQAIERDRDALEEQRLSLQSLKVRKQTIVEKLEEMGANLEEVRAEMPKGAMASDWEEELEALDRRISRLGAINLAAIEEYDAQAERKMYLDQQLADLEEALHTLEVAIDKIDKETKERFKETYDAVNNAFKELFPKIFGGGAAYLELTGDDLLDTGVTVMAQPPGKRNSTIHLLSGGEKALTALALVFSIFQLNPSPFCILDEVDAPLDDANVGRFCNLVIEMSEKVQFLFISHNKLAIEMSHQLVGVTMHEPGVSRLVAVDIEEAVAMAEV